MHFKLLHGGCLCDRPLWLVISTDPTAFNVRRRTEISAHHDASFCRRCSADWTLEFERRIISGHASLLPLFGQPMMSNSEHCTLAKRSQVTAQFPPRFSTDKEFVFKRPIFSATRFTIESRRAESGTAVSRQRRKYRHCRCTYLRR